MKILVIMDSSVKAGKKINERHRVAVYIFHCDCYLVNWYIVSAIVMIELTMFRTLPIVGNAFTILFLIRLNLIILITIYL